MRFEPVELADVARLHREWQQRVADSHHGVVCYNTQVAFTRPAVPLGEATVALATTGGAHLASQEPFNMLDHVGDKSYRRIPGTTPMADLRFTHDHYDHSDADVDPNCVFPLDRLRDLAAEGVIGAVASVHVSASGFLPDPNPFLAETSPAIIDDLRQAGVHVVLLTGG